MFTVGDADAMVLGDDMDVDGQNGLRVNPQPSYLKPNELCHHISCNYKICVLNNFIVICFVFVIIFIIVSINFY